ncbi:MAG: tRNA glutamyl-Q(34) synthetase GluQRS [Deltaproteobacteria bacterium]|nr:tRNA glutamyl-Q(34) synthetase GluQRS [Deltaproteobacteria bacterium]
MNPTPVVGRLAPTPSGHLHLGNACAFLAAWLSVRSQDGRLLLRVEDVDTTRARPDVLEGQLADLRWLGFAWDEEVAAQSARDYGPWLEVLRDHTYFCTCSRKDVADAGGIYPGTCRDGGHDAGKVRYRLPAETVAVVDRRFDTRIVDPSGQGDPVLRRADGVYAYDLAVVADDIADGVTEVVRGADLLAHTAVQVRLWEALGATPPAWMHTPLILGPDGRKLSKSHGSLHLGALREAGWRPRDVLRTILPWLGIEGADSLDAAVAAFDPVRGPRGPVLVETHRCPSPREGVSWRLEQSGGAP